MRFFCSQTQNSVAERGCKFCRAKFLTYLAVPAKKRAGVETGPGHNIDITNGGFMRITLQLGNTTLTIDLTPAVALSFMTMTMLSVPMA